jgi:hypothetical protein
MIPVVSEMHTANHRDAINNHAFLKGEQMRVLVIEDSQIHQVSARKTLEGHELTIIPSFDMAMKLLVTGVDEEKRQRLLSEMGLSVPDKDGPEDVYKKYWRTYGGLEKECIVPPPFDVILTDMNLPMSSKELHPEVYRHNEQVPYGFVIALRAAKVGVKFVAMMTCTGRHDGPLSKSLDFISGPSYGRDSFAPNFEINGAKVMFVHSPFVMENHGEKQCLCFGYAGCPDCNGSGKTDDLRETKAKDWGRVLDDLTKDHGSD